jgi:hypothetical protein
MAKKRTAVRLGEKPNYNKFIYFVAGGQGHKPQMYKVGKKNPR